MVQSLDDLKLIITRFGIKKILVNSESEYYFLKDELKLDDYNNTHIRFNSLFVDPSIEQLIMIKKHKSKKILILSDLLVKNKSLSRYLLKLKSINLSSVYTTSSLLKTRLDRVFIRNKLIKLIGNNTKINKCPNYDISFEKDTSLTDYQNKNHEIISQKSHKTIIFNDKKKIKLEILMSIILMMFYLI